jgi:O-Antigen ligase
MYLGGKLGRLPPYMVPDRLARRPFHIWRGNAYQAGVVAAGGGLAVTAGYVLVHRSFAIALALVLLPLAAWLLTRPAGGLAMGLVLILTLPNWWTLGGRHVYQIAAVLAASTALSARRPRFRPADYALLVYTVILVLGWLLQYDQPETWHIVLAQLTPIGFYLGARGLPSSRLVPFMTLALFAGTIGALTVIVEAILGHSVFIDPTAYLWTTRSSDEIFRPGGIFGNPPGAATVLTYVFFFGLASLTALRQRLKTLGLICVGVCSLALILTFTRGPLIGLGAGLVLFLWLVRSPLVCSARGALVVVVLAASLLVALPTLESNTTFREGVLRGGTLAARESYWTLALPIVFANPHNLTVGIGTGVLETPAIEPRAPLPFLVAAAPQDFEVSLHNQYVEALVEQGIIGLTALVVLLLAGLVPAVRGARATGDATYAALAASILATAIGFAVGTNAFHTPSLVMLFVAIGLAASVRAQAT